jgi:hypothetical protein
MSKHIRRADGTLAEVADDYVMQSGETFYAFMQHMDRAPDPTSVEHAEQVTRAAVAGGGSHVPPLVATHDGRGGPAGQRPGYVFAGDAALRDAASEDRLANEADAARDAMIDAVSGAWMRKPRTKRERRERERQKLADRQPPQSLADAERMRADAYAAHVEQLTNAWRSR